MSSTTDEIKAKIDIVDYVSQYVQLKKAGYNYKGLCPFHKEKSPSFMVSPDKQIAYCFGCRKGGDIFRFVMEVEHLDFVDTLKTLAKRAGVELEQVNEPQLQGKERLFRMHEIAQRFFEEQLQAENGGLARDYLEKRELTSSQISHFGIGYAPDGYNSLVTLLMEKEYTKEEIKSSGLGAVKEGGTELHDKFRNRIIFPVRNTDGDIVAFAGRALSDGQQPKYLNSPETPIYHKSRILYNFSSAKEAIKSADQVIIVEGYMDAIAVEKVGMKNVVAICGTALTEEHTKLLKRFASVALLCFDNDNAGLEAIKRNSIPALGSGMIAKTLDLKNYKDPDEYIRADFAGFKAEYEKPIDLITFLLGKLEQQYNTQIPEGRRKIIESLSPIVRSISLASEREWYAKLIAKNLGSSTESILKDLMATPRYEYDQKKEVEKKEPDFRLSTYVLGMLLLHQEWASEMLPHCSPELFGDSLEKKVYSILSTQYNAGAVLEKVGPIDLSGDLEKAELEQTQIFCLLVEKEYEHLSDELLKKELLKLIGRLQHECFTNKKISFLSQLQEAKNKDIEVYKKLLEDYQKFLSAPT